MYIVAVIPAKGKSTRLPNKNICNVWNKPMICWAILACKESKKYNIVPWVNTDSEEIANIAMLNKANVCYRDNSIIGNEVPKQEIIRSTLKFLNLQNIYPDIVISLQANSPQITGNSLDNAIDKLMKYNKNEIFSVDDNLIQNAAFRVMKADYVNSKDLSTHCGVIVYNAVDIHTKDDIEILEKLNNPHNICF